MQVQRNASTADVDLYAVLARFGLVAMLAIGGAQNALGQARPGGAPAPTPAIGSLADAVMVYPAQSAPGACGEKCSEWLAAEGTVHWDGHKRIIAGLDRFADRKRPVFLNVREQSNLGVATSIGRILRERGIEVGVGETIADQCRTLSASECVALKRSGGPLRATLKSIRL